MSQSSAINYKFSIVIIHKYNTFQMKLTAGNSQKKKLLFLRIDNFGSKFHRKCYSKSCLFTISVQIECC